MRKNYLLRDIPADLWRKVKVKCDLEQRSIRQVIFDRLEKWIEGRG